MESIRWKTLRTYDGDNGTSQKKADDNFSEDFFDLSKAGLNIRGEAAEVKSNRPFQQTYQSILAVKMHLYRLIKGGQGRLNSLPYVAQSVLAQCLGRKQNINK